ncbi:unnamed protein product [Calypogeia fissa]
MAEITLFSSRYSSFGQRVQIALTEKGIPFELVKVDFGNKPQALLDANPIYKKVPTIIHNGKPVAESIVILEYLEEAFPEKVPLMPKDAFGKSQVRFWTDYVYQIFSKVSAGLRAQPGSPAKLATAGASATFLKTLDGAMTKFSAAGPFFMGDKFGYLDVVAAPFCSTLGVISALGGGPIPGPEELPRFYKWVEAVKVHPSVSSTLPSGDETLEFVKARFSQLSLAPK